MTTSTFTILAVCTGNICRSPAAERLLAAGLPDDLGVTVRSAGTFAQEGSPMEKPMRHLVRDHGAYIGGFKATRLTPVLVQSSDLVLAMARTHRSAVASLVPAAVKRTFALREFAAIIERSGSDLNLSDVPCSERAAALTQWCVEHRFLAGHGRPADDDDIIDPYRHGNGTYRRSFEQIEPAVEAIVQVLRG